MRVGPHASLPPGTQTGQSNARRCGVSRDAEGEGTEVTEGTGSTRRNGGSELNGDEWPRRAARDMNGEWARIASSGPVLRLLAIHAHPPFMTSAEGRRRDHTSPTPLCSVPPFLRVDPVASFSSVSSGSRSSRTRARPPEQSIERAQRSRCFIVSLAALMVALMSRSVCAPERNHASNCDGGG